MSSTAWRERLAGVMPPDLAEEIDVFEAQLELRRQGRVEEKLFAETRLRRGVYGQRYDEEDAKPAAERAPPPVLNTCHALVSDSPVVKQRWPLAYTGRDRETDSHTRLLLDDCIT